MVVMLLLAVLAGQPDSTIVRDPADLIARRAVGGADTAGCVIVRMLADFTGDGHTDVTVSATCGFDDGEGWGNAGGPWEVYAYQPDNGGYRFLVELFCHPWAISLAPADSGVIITTYHRLGGGEARLVRRRLTGAVLTDREETPVRGTSQELGALFDEMFPPEKRLRCQACKLADVLSGRPEWAPGYLMPSSPD